MTPHTFFARRRSIQLTSPSMQRQRGLATILIIITISLAMTAAAFGAIYSLRGNQNMQVAAHAQTHSQASAWAGVEVLRKYLAQLAQTPDSLVSLTDSDDLVMSIANSSQELSLKAEIIKVQEPMDITVDNTYEVTANIHSADSLAKSTSVVQVLYRVSPFSCGGDAELNATLDFYRDLDISGDVNVKTEEGETADFYVDGDISLLNVSTSGITSLRSTGNVDLGSGIFLPEVHANGDIVMTGSATVGKAFSVGSLTTSGAANVTGEAFINGDINFGGGSSGDLNSLADIYINSGGSTVGDVNTAGQVNLINASKIGNVSAKDDVNIVNSYFSIGEILTESDVICSQNNTSNFSSIEAQGSVNGNCSPANTSSGVDVDVINMDPEEPFYMQPVIVDAWAVRDSANYLFEWDDVNKQIQITVKNINTIPDGVYYVGENFTDNKKDYLCDAVDGASKCTSAPVAKICNSYSEYNVCFTYDEATTTLAIGGTNMAPGVVWVEGNLELGNGRYYNTMIASGDIHTANSHKTQAINYAGYDIICDNDFPVNQSNNFTELYPTNFCDVSTNTLSGSSLGNIALLAGGNNPNTGGAYEGGDITLGASTEIFGTILAGNYLFTEGSTTVHGYVSASGSGAEIVGQGNELGSSTTIDLTGLPETYNPEFIPEMGQVSSCEVPGDSTIARTFWTKYL